MSRLRPLLPSLALQAFFLCVLGPIPELVQWFIGVDCLVIAACLWE